MKYIKYTIVSSLLTFIVIMSSCNFLDVDEYFDNMESIDSVFASQEKLERYLWAIPLDFVDEGGLWDKDVPGCYASDEMITARLAAGQAFSLGMITDENATAGGGNDGSLSRGMNIWAKYYKTANRASTVIRRMDECKDLSPSNRRLFLGYAHFIRAYAYCRLSMNYGPLILVKDEEIMNNENSEYYNRARSTYDETIDYICEEFEKAAEYMPAAPLSIQLFGRPSKEAAYALIARLRLMQASPLFNGQEPSRIYGDWIRKSDGVNYISQTYSEEKWAVAAAAAKRVIETGKYNLHIVIVKDADKGLLPANVPSAAFPDGAGNVDPFHSYSDMFTGQTIGLNNPEYIWGRNSAAVRDEIKQSFSKKLFQGNNSAGVTQKMVDAYYMVDGHDRNSSSAEYPYTENYGFLENDKSFYGYTLKGGSVHNMYLNREARFYASVGFTGRLWRNLSTTDDNYKNKIINYYMSDTDSGRNHDTGTPDFYPLAGYVTTKFIHDEDAIRGPAAFVMEKSFPIIRYAEIMLSYAEAINNLTASYTITLGGKDFTVVRDPAEMRANFNPIRFRAGLPGLNGEENDVASFQKVLERERMIEFFGENRRFYDIRRWGTFIDIEKDMQQGMDMDAASKEGYYKRVPINNRFARDRVSDRKLLFLPIPKVELRKVRLMDQNPGY